MWTEAFTFALSSDSMIRIDNTLQAAVSTAKDRQTLDGLRRENSLD